MGGKAHPFPNTSQGASASHDGTACFPAPGCHPEYHATQARPLSLDPNKSSLISSEVDSQHREGHLLCGRAANPRFLVAGDAHR